MFTPADFEHQTRQVGALNMHMVVEGAEDARPLILLHGFPEFWYGWVKQIKPLAAAGFRVIVPDQRGYNLTDKQGPYDVFTLVEDVANLIRSFGYQKVSLVGHDWGGIVAWIFASRYPEMLDRLVVCNVPHPMAGIQAVWRFYLPQMLKSWYITFFGIPLLPEWSLRVQNFRALERNVSRAAKGSISPEMFVYYREAWSQPDALPAMIGWYRALLRHQWSLRRTFIPIPARLIWGEPDFALDTKLAEWTREWVAGLDLVYVPNSCHFVQHDQPERVTQLILEYLK
ncbi:MAG: alpha/beta hydrolase [Anaerolineae bacterium]|nr:alpha/beta hydrolase [Anaerolineae bacterium]